MIKHASSWFAVVLAMAVSACVSPDAPTRDPMVTEGYIDSNLVRSPRAPMARGGGPASEQTTQAQPPPVEGATDGLAAQTGVNDWGATTVPGSGGYGVPAGSEPSDAYSPVEYGPQSAEPMSPNPNAQ